MARNIVFRDGLKILGTLDSGAGDPTLTRDATSLAVGEAPATDASVLLSINLADGFILIGNELNLATQRQVVGDITINNQGVASITPNTIVNADINSAAGIVYSKLNLTDSIINNDISPTAGIEWSKLELGNPWRVMITDATGLVTEANLITPLRALVSDANGIPIASGVTTTVLEYLLGTTSNIQTQLNNRLLFSSAITPTEGDLIYYNGAEWINLPRGTTGQVLTSTATTVAWGVSSATGLPPGGTTRQALLKTDGTDYNATWYTLNPTDIGTTSSVAELNILTGATLTTAELNYVDGVTNPIQPQIDSKLSKSLTYNSLFVGNASNEATMLAPGTDDYVLTMVGGAPAWQPTVPPGDVSGPGGTSTDRAIVTWNGTTSDALRDNSILIDASSNITGVASLQTINQGGIILRELTANGTDAVTIRAHGTMGASYTITLPAAAPGSNTFLKYDGADYVWAVGGGGGASAFTDLTDTFASYAGLGGRALRVNAGATGVEAYDQTITLSSDVTGTGITSIATTISANAVTNAKFRQSVGTSVVGRSGSTTGDVADIAASADNQVLRRSSGTLGFGTIPALSMTMNTNRILGRDDGGAGSVEELQVLNGLHLDASSIKLGGALIEHTSITGGTTFNYTVSGIATLNLQGAETLLSSNTSTIWLQSDGIAHNLILGDAGGVVFNIGSDAANDLYYRSLSGKFDRIPIGTAGQLLMVATTGTPVWSNTLIEDVSSTTYTFTANDNGKIKRFTHASGCTANIPVSLPSGWSSSGYRAVGAGITTFTSSGTVEATATTLSSEKTVATIYHRGGDVHVIFGALGAGVGTGTVTSVGLSGITGILTVGNSPIVTAGTLTMSLDTQAAGTSLMGPVSGGSATPGFRLLELTDLPNNAIDLVTGTTYTLLSSDNKRIKLCTNPSGCAVTIPTGLPTGWESVVSRASSAGSVSLTSLGTYEGAGSVLSIPNTSASIVHRGSDAHMVAGPFADPVITTKGDLLTWTTLPARLPVGTNGQVLTADSTVAAGIKWAAAGAGTVTSVALAPGSAGSDVNVTGSPITSSGTITFNIPDASATARGLITTGAQTIAGAKTFSSAPTFSTMTSGSILFAGTGGLVSQDNAELFWDNTNNYLGVGTNVPEYYLHVKKNFASQIFSSVQNTNTSSGAHAGFRAENGAGLRFDSYITSSGLTATGHRKPNTSVMEFSSTNGLLLAPVSTQPVIITDGNPYDKVRLYIGTTGVYVGNPKLAGTVTPTAALHLPAGVATAGGAPIKFITGTPLTTPEDGVLEYHTSHLYFTIGSTRYQLDQQGGGSGTPAGSNREIQINNSGAFGVAAISAPTAGNLQLGDVSTSGDRTIQAVNTAGNASLNLITAGGNFTIGDLTSTSGETTISQTATGSTKQTVRFRFGGQGTGNAPAYIFDTPSSAPFNDSSLGQILVKYNSDISGQTGTASFIAEQNLINLGSRTATGEVYYATYGVQGLGDNIKLHKDGHIIIGNGTAPSAAETNGIKIYSSDSSDTTATLSLRTEQVVEAIGTFTASHKFKININGTFYWIQLDAV